MTRAEVKEKLIEKILEIQEISEREKLEISDDTIPIGGVPGFDSHNDLEITIGLTDDFSLPDDDKFRLCVSEDGKKALTVNEIVDKVMEHLGS